MMGHNYFSLETTKYRQLKDRLLADYPSLDDETLADTLEGITDLNEMIAAVIRSALVDEALQSGLRQRLDEMKVRMVRLEQRSKRKRELCLEAMTEVGIKKLEQPDFTVSARAGFPGLVVMDEAIIPEAYWLPQEPKLDRQALLSDLKRSAKIPGAQLNNPGPVLSVRTK
jgi:hypothetical protein